MTRNAETQIEEALTRIIGAPMWGSARAVDMEMFAFGQRMQMDDREGRILTKGEFALHVQCAWHLERSGVILIGSRDLYVPADGRETVGQFDWESYLSNRRDVLLARFFDETTSAVEGIEAESGGVLSVNLSGHHSLRLFPDRSTKEIEHWRFLQPGSQEPHLVLMSDGLTTE